MDTAVVVAAKYIEPSGKPLTEDLVYGALAYAVNKHAALSVRILGARELKPKYARFTEVHLDQLLFFLGNEDKRSIAEIMHGEFFNPFNTSMEHPLWRVIVTPDGHIFYSWHHALGDGNSGPIVLRTILEGLNVSSRQPNSESFPRVIHPSSELKLTPPLEELTDLSVSIRTFLSEIWKEVIPTGWRLRKTWTGNKVVKKVSEATEIHVKFITIRKDVSARLLSSARKHETTLTGILYILGVSVLSRMLSERAPKKYKRIVGVLPVSYQKLAQIPPTAIADAVSIYTSHDKLDPEFSWVKAASFSKKLHKSIPRLREEVGIAKILNGHFEEYHLAKLGKKRENSLLISNLGPSRADQGLVEGPWEIEDMYFSQDIRVLGSALKLNVIGSPNGNVNIGLTWGEGVVENEFAESFAGALETSIVELSEKTDQ